ncbi:MAG: TolC family protein [Gammaproteobacteria bacterium]|nr:TolC family protein [Gammaproteobacteria bacterium]
MLFLLLRSADEDPQSFDHDTALRSKCRRVATARSSNKLILLTTLTLLASGCASINPQDGFDKVSADVQQRIGNRVYWYTGSPEDTEVKQSVRETLAQPLTSASAVQVALLNNHTLQAKYADLGISQADLVQAGLLKNPALELTRLKPRKSGEPDDALDVEIRFEFLDMLLIPLRKKVAAQQYEAAKRQVTVAVLDHAASTRKAFYAVQTAQQVENMFSEIQTSTAAALEAATRLRKIGNINQGAFDNFKLQDDEVKLTLAEAQLATRSSRERLSQLMGVSGEQTGWTIEGGLKPIPFEAIDLSDIEQRAVDNSLDLAILRHQVQAIADRAGVDNVESVINDLELGFAWDREASGEWNDGPIIEFRVPIFDLGFARRARVQSQIQQIKAMYTAETISIQGNARLLADRLRSSREIVEQYIDTILPLNRSIKDYALLNYNAMQIDVFRLLRAHEKQVNSYQRFANALSNYWMARADLETLLSGRSLALANMSGPAIGMGGADEGGH